MSLLKYKCTYETRTGKIGVICTCGRKALLTFIGIVYRHSPLQGSGWCDNGGKHVSELRPSI